MAQAVSEKGLTMVELQQTPERLYHFMEAKYAFDDLRNRRLKIAQFNNLNDPFELRSVDLSDPIHKWAVDRFIEEMEPRFGLLCFSERWNDVLQWSHYADHHKGICLGFDVSGAVGKFGPVCYVPTKKKFPEKIDMSHTEFMWELLRTKYERWESENEWRVFIELKDAIWNENAGRNLYFADFGRELVLREVLLGAENSNDASEVRDAISGYPGAETVQVARIHLSPSTFELERNVVSSARVLHMPT